MDQIQSTLLSLTTRVETARDLVLGMNAACDQIQLITVCILIHHGDVYRGQCRR